MVEHVEFLVEEQSTAEALRALLPRMMGSLSFSLYAHQGKRDLLARLPGKLRGYARWIPRTWKIVVVVDRDDGDCRYLKSKLEEIATVSGMATRTAPQGSWWTLVNRIAVEELEAWYFGDWQAVRKAYPKVAAGIPRQAEFRRPDDIRGGTWEAFERVMQSAGYFRGGLRKIEAARLIAEHMNPTRNASESFRALRDVLLEMAAE